ncbi:MAG: cyclopropane-fatty-acyl-phospholipid synthase family protein [Actinomycetota bacterium]|nr:methyltransferase domain-containing protein [Actinomycetota bacterium]
MAEEMQLDEAKIEEFAGRVFMAGLGATELFTMYFGQKLGLYEALQEKGGMTAAELAKEASIDERYTREWLEQQAAAAILTVDDQSAPGDARRYTLPAEHALALLDSTFPAFIGPIPQMVAVVGRVVDPLVEGFRTGRGVPYAEYGPEAVDVQAGFYKPGYVSQLAQEWLPQIPDVHDRLQADPPARIADLASGGGWPTIAIAKGYPKVQIDGYDLDEYSVTLARKNAAEEGVADRVEFHVADASDSSLTGTYDVVTVFEAVHDLGRPVEFLQTVKRLVAPGGAVIIADEKTADSFTAPADEMERFLYGASLVWCLPMGLADAPSAGTGAVIRERTFRDYATKAGFKSVEVLPIEHPGLRFYRLHS